MTRLTRDLIERCGATFVEAGLAALVASAAVNGLTIDGTEAAAVAGFAAVAALLKGAIATRWGDKRSASLVE